MAIGLGADICSGLNGCHRYRAHTFASSEAHLIDDADGGSVGWRCLVWVARPADQPRNAQAACPGKSCYIAIDQGGCADATVNLTQDAAIQ